MQNYTQLAATEPTIDDEDYGEFAEGHHEPTIEGREYDDFEEFTQEETIRHTNTFGPEF